MTIETIEIVSPLGRRENRKTTLAKRTGESLHALRIGLLDNNKPNADKFLAFIGELLERRHSEVALIGKRKMSRTEADCLPELIARCDVVINAFAD
jgi:hypothetical protein